MIGRFLGGASMRPPEFTGGNREAVTWRDGETPPRFNEAAGIHRRKPANTTAPHPAEHKASMRPPEFTGGNPAHRLAVIRLAAHASMRPPEFTGGNDDTVSHTFSKTRFNEAAGIHRRKRRASDTPSATDRHASMRPPEFTGGNARSPDPPARRLRVASMRPPEFTGGNSMDYAYHKLEMIAASMRPPEFTGGNPSPFWVGSARQPRLQ